MRTLPAIFTCVVVVCAVAVSPAQAAETATASITVNVQIAARTSLKVSSQLVQFDVFLAGAPATASIDFMAGARVPSDADVILTVEPLQNVDGPDGVADVGESAITFYGDGEGLVRGRLDRQGPAVAGRWQGSGLRHGRLSFTICPDAAGRYTVPIRVVLSTP